VSLTAPSTKAALRPVGARGGLSGTATVTLGDGADAWPARSTAIAW
jgi:hypothetical protein